MSKNILILSATVLATLTLPAAQGAPRTASDSAQETLRDVRSVADSVKDDAATLREMIELTRYSNESHAAILTSLKNEVNRMGRDIQTIEARRDSLPSWERTAIDRVLPLAQETAAVTSKAIDYYNDNPNYLWSPKDAAYAQAIYDDSNKIANTLTHYLKAEKLRNEESAVDAEISADSNN